MISIVSRSVSKRHIGFILALFLALGGFAAPSSAVDWAGVNGKDVTLFYPAQMSWEVLLTQADHSGAGKFRQGKDCRACHEGEEADSGKLLVSDKTAEPTPIPGKPGSIKANIKFAHDADQLYVHIEFEPGAQPDAGQEPKFDTKVALMFDDGRIVEMDRGGCFAACHIDSAKMPSAGNKDLTMYLPKSRVTMTRTGGDAVKSADDLAKVRADGGAAEYWQVGLNPGAPPVVSDGTVLEKRQENATPVATATASFDKGKWSVTFARKLSAGNGYKDLAPGRVYTVGFAIHAGHTNKRFHYVTLEKTFTLDSGNADFVAARTP